MGDPRNPARADETWDSDKLAVLEEEIIAISDLVTISGGWAWHFISPPHRELKLLHDHKDIDVFVEPNDFTRLIEVLYQRGYLRARTQYDGVSKDFYRYKKFLWVGDTTVKVIIDVFIEAVPFVEANGVKVVEPTKLLSYYDLKKHTTDDCIAVKAARKLLSVGTNPIGRVELVTP